MDINKATLLQNDITTLLSVLETKYNVRLECESGKYFENRYIPSIVFKDVETLDMNVEHTILSQKLGYEYNIIGKSINYLGSMCEIIDIKTRNKKYPIIIKDKMSGKEHKIEKVDISIII